MLKMNQHTNHYFPLMSIWNFSPNLVRRKWTDTMHRCWGENGQVSISFNKWATQEIPLKESSEDES